MLRSNFYFMEMNTRLQVEHPISEMVTGVDIVKAQIEIAEGKPLPLEQKDIQINGFAIESRLNAENPYKNFQPSSGHISRLFLPTGGMGLRVETGLYSDYTLPPFYDSMVAKIITHQTEKDAAFTLMERALYEVVVDGIDTNVDLLEALISHPDVIAGTFHVKWLEEVFMPNWQKTDRSEEA